MKKLIVYLLMLISVHALAQQNGLNDQAVNTLIANYNKGDYTSLYNQLSSEFKKQLPEPDLTKFYQQKIEQPCGKAISWKYLEKTNNFTKYLVNFERAKLLLIISLKTNLQLSSFVWLPAKDPETIKTNNPRQTPIQRHVDSVALAYLMDARNSSLSIAIVDGDKAETLFYGETKKGNSTLPTENSIYEIASISKTFTGIMLAHAVNQKKISLQDDIRKYLPGNFSNLEYKGTPIRVMQLANHTSGLPRLPENFDKQAGYDSPNPYKTYSKQAIYQALADFKPDTVPGRRAEYSNFGFAVLGVILENVYQKPINALVEEIITRPLRMTVTRYDLDESQLPLRVSGYSGESGAEVPFWDFLAFKAAGGLKSDLTDLLRYLKGNMQPASTDISLSQQGDVKSSKKVKSLAWVIQPLKGDTLIWHNGRSGGFSSFLGFVKGKKTGVIVLSNSNMSVDNVAIKILSFEQSQQGKN
ncbi:MAG: serine hydrolase [Sphingobacteriaceae bacterium]